MWFLVARTEKERISMRRLCLVVGSTVVAATLFLPKAATAQGPCVEAKPRMFTLAIFKPKPPVYLHPYYSPVIPICQRWAVLKNRAWLVRSLRKTCGGGSSRGSAHPAYHKTSQMAVKRPTETIVQKSCGNHRRRSAARRCQRGGVVRGAAAVRIFPLAPLAHLGARVRAPVEGRIFDAPGGPV